MYRQRYRKSSRRGRSLRARYESFSPIDIPDLFAWWDATKRVTFDGSNRVTQWDDISGNDRHFVPVVPSDLSNEAYSASTIFHLKHTCVSGGKLWELAASGPTSGSTPAENATWDEITGNANIYSAAADYTVNDFVFAATTFEAYICVQNNGVSSAVKAQSDTDYWYPITVNNMAPAYAAANQNGLPAIDFVANHTLWKGKCMQVQFSSVFTPSDYITVFCAYNRNDAGADKGASNILLDGYGSSDGRRLTESKFGDETHWQIGPSISIYDETIAIWDTWQVTTGELYGPNANEPIIMWIDNSVVLTSSAAGNGWKGIVLDGLNLGNRGTYASQGNSSNSFDGQVGEIIIYNRRLTNDEIQRVNRHLMTKWGI